MLLTLLLLLLAIALNGHPNARMSSAMLPFQSQADGRFAVSLAVHILHFAQRPLPLPTEEPEAFWKPIKQGQDVVEDR